MSNMRKATGRVAGDTGHSWAENTCKRPLPVRGAWTTSMPGPVVWADASGRRDVTGLARGHRETSEGVVRTQWVLAFSPNMAVQPQLMVRFTRPVRIEFALAFGPGHLDVLVNIAEAGTVSMVTRKLRVVNGAIECRNAVAFEVDRPRLVEALDKLPALHAMTRVMGNYSRGGELTGPRASPEPPSALWRAKFNSIDYASGLMVWQFAEHKCGLGFATFLARIAQTLPDDPLILILVIDDVSYHRSPVVRTWWAEQAGRMTPFWLPVYAPQFNLMERVWRFLKQKLACHRFSADAAGLEAAAMTVLDCLEEHFHIGTPPGLRLCQDFCESA